MTIYSFNKCLIFFILKSLHAFLKSLNEPEFCTEDAKFLQSIQILID